MLRQRDTDPVTHCGRQQFGGLEPPRPAAALLLSPGEPYQAEFVESLRAVGYDGFINFIDPFLPGKTVSELAGSTATYARSVVPGG